MELHPVTLTGQRIRLKPLTMRYLDDLTAVAAHDEIWTYLDEPVPFTRSHVEAFITDAQRQQDAGTRIAFAVIDRATGIAVGTISYQDIRPHDRGVELGWTWLTPDVWGTGINTEATHLLLAHAFNTAGAIRVSMKTDQRNTRSQRAIEAAGGRREGVWRNHRILHDGHHRNTIWYSIIDTEWRRR